MDSDRRKNYLRFCFRSNIKEPFLYSSFGCYRPQTKLWKGNVFTPVCQSSVHRGGVHTTPGRHPPRQRPPIGRRTQADTTPSGSPPPRADTLPVGRHRPPPRPAAADGTHLTGMHSCSFYTSIAPFLVGWRSFSALYIENRFPPPWYPCQRQIRTLKYHVSE